LVHQCEVCAQSRGPPTRHEGRLQKVLTSALLDIVAIDILSGLPTTPDVLKYILVVTDYFTKWATAFALPDAEANSFAIETVILQRAMYDGFFSVFVLPCHLPSDQGKNFESKVFREMCELTGIVKTRTPPFHPQCDGQTEHMNHTLLQMLRCTADENPANWPQRLPTVMSAYCCCMTVHKVTGLTPNMAMFGREVMLPTSLVARPPRNPSPHRYHLWWICGMQFAMCMIECEQQLRRLLGSSESIMTRSPDKPLSGRANWCGCFGHNLPSAKSLRC